MSVAEAQKLGYTELTDGAGAVEDRYSSTATQGSQRRSRSRRVRRR